MPAKEWLTQQEIADQLGINNIERVRTVISTLDSAGVIRTTRNPNDKRYILVHVDSLPAIRRALLGEIG